MNKKKKFLITGGSGFIGSAVIRFLIRNNCQILNVDKLTYASNPKALKEVEGSTNYSFLHADICDEQKISEVFNSFQPDCVMHLAAESHVDRSIVGPKDFINTNIIGTYTLLEIARNYWSKMSDDKRDNFIFHHISTDEVYGSLLAGEQSFTEDTQYSPNSPYSASKASSDHLVRAWHKTFDLPTVITNCSNNYGSFQNPEKFIPNIIFSAIKNLPIPIYGDGLNIRDWLYVDDHVKALFMIINNAQPGSVYNIGGGNERSNIEIVDLILQILAGFMPKRFNISNLMELKEFVTDRPGHDFRYSIDASKLSTEFGWSPDENLESGMEKTIKWYIKDILK